MNEANHVQQTSYQDSLTKPMTVKQWLGTLALLMIPLVNIVLVFVWAFSENVNINKKNYFRASLLLTAIVLGIYIAIVILIFIFAALMAGVF